ncbi:MAG: hypothetical protein KJ626_08445 [Verrucomicrobia bacterium]|nr:hypothetical protein [Verrucomicrobiota bacterium]
MKTLRLTSFGIRGFIGDSLTPKTVMDYASAFGSFLEGGTVLLGRDTRSSSPMIHAEVLSSLLAAGCDVVDFGVCPTPVLQYSVKPYKARGGVSISGGHNGMGWNAVTLIDSEGALFESVSGEAVMDLFHAGDFRFASWDQMGRHSHALDFFDPYLAALEKHINADGIRDADLRILIDPVGGAGCSYLKAFARRFGFSLIPMNAEPSGYLAREPEPRPRSALQMASIIKHLKGDAGFLLSSDMGRMSIVTETGEPASEEYTFAIIASHILSKKTGTIVTNCCTTRAMDDITALKKASLVKAKVGQASIIAALADEDGLLGGEGCGSVACPEFSQAFDGFLMMALVMEAMAENNCTVSELLNALPRYHIVKKAVPCGAHDGYKAVEYLQSEWAPSTKGEVDLTDGVRVDWEDGWIHARISQTEQIVRIISEATSKAKAEKRADELKRVIRREI